MILIFKTLRYLFICYYLQLYPKEKNDAVIPLIEFKNCSKQFVFGSEVCENKNWIYYTREGNQAVDNTIKINFSKEGIFHRLLQFDCHYLLLCYIVQESKLKKTGKIFRSIQKCSMDDCDSDMQPINYSIAMYFGRFPHQEFGLVTSRKRFFFIATW